MINRAIANSPAHLFTAIDESEKMKDPKFFNHYSNNRLMNLYLYITAAIRPMILLCFLYIFLVFFLFLKDNQKKIINLNKNFSKLKSEIIQLNTYS